MNNRIDNDIKKALDIKVQDVNASDDLLTSIKHQLQEERKIENMKKLKFTPKTILVSALLTVALATGVIASSGLGGGIISHSDKREAINHYPTSSEVEKVVNYSPKFVEDLQGYKFKSAQPSESSDLDEAGNEISSQKEISFYYETDKGILNLNTSQVVRENDAKGEPISYKGITLYYSSYTYKAVPPDYVVTEEDKKLEESGKLMIGYGSDKISEEKTQNIIWVDNGITYDLLDMGAEIDKNDLIEMAKQVIDAK